MAVQATSAICLLSIFEPFLKLRAFPPAQNYCSSLFSESPVQVGDPKCHSESDLCELLSYIKAIDHEFAQQVCCCIGECHESKSTLISIATSPESSTASANSEKRPTRSTSSVHSESPRITTNAQTTPNTTTSSSFETSFTTRSTSSSIETSFTAGSTPSSTVPSTTSYRTCATCSYPTPTAACTAINGYEQYYTGQCHVENTDNPGTVDPLYPPIYSTYPGTLNACDAASTCALQSEGFDADVYTSFDLHFLCSNSSWVCVQYYGANFRGSSFDVQDFDAVVAYGYYSLGNHG